MKTTNNKNQKQADCYKSGNRRHDARSAKRPSADRPVKGNVQEITPAGVEELLAPFLEASEIKTRQCVYIDRETHRKISDIVKYLGSGLSIGKYVDNVLRDHINKPGCCIQSLSGTSNR